MLRLARNPLSPCSRGFNGLKSRSGFHAQPAGGRYGNLSYGCSRMTFSETWRTMFRCCQEYAPGVIVFSDHDREA